MPNYFFNSSAIYDQINKDVSIRIENVSQLRNTHNLVKNFWPNKNYVMNVWNSGNVFILEAVEILLLSFSGKYIAYFSYFFW